MVFKKIKTEKQNPPSIMDDHECYKPKVSRKPKVKKG